MKYRQGLCFLLDGETVEVEGVNPNRTLLEFLREDKKRSGTKEGCAEGDCGACTVVVVDADASGKRLEARAVNACICLLPTIDGKELLTVESLAREELHPVQQAMLECHGSQCGFCTPGFVMSLFALYKSNEDPGRRDVDDALAGNLCRCTGYRPIIRAAKAMYEAAPATGDWISLPAGRGPASDEAEKTDRLQSLVADSPLRIEAQGRRFFAPRDSGELALLLQEHPDATLLAGGTDLALRVTKQHQDFSTLVYTGKVAELCQCEITDTHIEIGAAVSLTDAFSLIAAHYPTLGELFVRFASPPIRNAGTLGGNIANGSPIGDSMPALLVLGAEIVLCRGEESRTISLDDFYVAYQQTALRPGEFLVRILLPLPRAGQQLQSYKVSKRFDQDISAVCGAYRLELDGTRVADIRIACGGMAEVPKRARNCEQALAGAEWSESAIDAAMAAFDEDFTPISDMRAADNYRQQVCKNLLRRFYLETTSGHPQGVYTYGR